jgi:hypothetical protein
VVVEKLRVKSVAEVQISATEEILTSSPGTSGSLETFVSLPVMAGGSKEKMIGCLQTWRTTPRRRLVPLRGDLLEALRRIEEALTQDGVDGIGSVQAGDDRGRAFRQPRFHDRSSQIRVAVVSLFPGQSSSHGKLAFLPILVQANPFPVGRNSLDVVALDSWNFGKPWQGSNRDVDARRLADSSWRKAMLDRGLGELGGESFSRDGDPIEHVLGLFAL